MIVSCPACATRFSLDASLLGPAGRNVRCAKCSHRWHQDPPPAVEPLPQVELDPPAEPSPAQMAPGLAALLGGREQLEKPAAQVVVPPKLRPAPPKRKVGVWPWILLLGILCGLAVAAYIFQGPISRMFPATQDLYGLFQGGSDPARVLQIGNLKSEQRSGFLSVRGDVFNPSDYPLKVPPLMLMALDANGTPLGTAFMFRAQEAEIAPGETITFRIPFENPPKGMKGFSVTFGRVNAAAK